MKKLFGVAQLEEGCSCASSIKKHDELKSFGRFWEQEIRDFLIRRHTVVSRSRKDRDDRTKLLAVAPPDATRHGDTAGREYSSGTACRFLAPSGTLSSAREKKLAVQAATV
jgi:hypothetical protein